MDVRDLSSHELALILQVQDAINSSLDFKEVFPQAYQAMAQLLPSDYGALCMSIPGQPAAYEWLVTERLAPYFDAYARMSDEDFVRRSSMRHPGVVLRDTEMVSREVLERSSLYQHGHALGMPIERVMAVMLDVNEDWHAGLMLYRADRRHPFDEHARDIFQWLTPRWAATVRNCRRFSEEVKHRHFLEVLGRYQKDSLLVLAPPSKEVKRTGRTTELLQKWFTASERGRSGVPKVLLERLSVLVRAEGALKHGPDTWVRERADSKLKVTFVRLPVEGQMLWVLTLEEVPRDLLSTWRQKLTPAEVRIMESLLQGYTNKDIADDLRRAVGTVKKHLTRIYKKLGVDGRADFISRALRP